MLVRSISFPDHFGLKQQTINFCPENLKTRDNYISVIIGPNGCGKSTVLRDITNIFREAYDCKSYVKTKYMIDYICNGNNQLIRKTNTRYFQNEKGESYYDFPQRVIAVSLNSTDKFPFSKDNGQYRYAGVRSSNNNSGTKTIIKQLIELLSNLNYEKIEVLKTIFRELNFEEELIIYFPVKSHKVLKNIESFIEFKSYFENWDKRIDSNRKTMPFSLSQYKKIDETELEKIYKFLQFMPQQIYYNVFDENEFLNFKNNYQMLKYLYKLDLIKISEIKLKKKNTPGQELTQNDLSSGEYNLIIQFLKVLINIENESLLLIDEPETSLHPNWQMKYIPLLQKVLKEFTGIHIIIATHSNLLLSNLNPDNCSLVTVSNDGFYELLDYSVSGWSPENILYNVFNVTSYRNYYFSDDLLNIIQYLENKKNDYEDIQNRLNHIEKFTLTENDPLKKIIDKAKEKLQNDL